MIPFSRREFLSVGVATAASALLRAADAPAPDVHRQLLELAGKQQDQRRARFAAVRTPAELEVLQKALRESFLRLIGGLPESAGVPPSKKVGEIDADDYLIEKIVFESIPGYFVPALLYKPRKVKEPLPGVISPCGHSAVGKAADSYQILHINLVRRGYVVLSYDPVGQGERSQYWDAEKGKSRFNLQCGEHAVLGNPLYLLGENLARYRIWDGIRAIDYLSSRPEVDAKRIGCAGNSGGGTLTAYIAALDPRVAVAAICCYITTLPRRMGNRITADPDADPEQDIFDFVGQGIDHAGLVALRTPRPTLIGSAVFDFFPIEGARESFAEAKRLFEVAGAEDRIEQAEAKEKHGLTLPLRQAVYKFFDRWLAGKKEPASDELPVTPRDPKTLVVCKNGQVNVTYRSKPLLPLAIEAFDARPKGKRVPLKELLRLDLDSAVGHVSEAVPVREGKTVVLCVNGNESSDWRDEKDFLAALSAKGHGVMVIDPRGVGRLRPEVGGRSYTDPLTGAEENIAYNAFLVGKTLAGMRVADVIDIVRKTREKSKPSRVVVCGRRDGALIATLAAVVEPAIDAVAVEEMSLSFRSLFDVGGTPINAASIVPGLLRDVGDVPELLSAIAPRKILIAAGVGKAPTGVRHVEGRFTKEPLLLIDWMSI